MIIIYHSKDNDGIASGAICKLKYPNATLLGWDYIDEIPNLQQFYDEDVIMIDVTFPIETTLELARVSRLTIIDHHISFKNQIDQLSEVPFKFIYESGIGACEIGWKYLFPHKKIPFSILLIGKYDTWRDYGTTQWNDLILPFKYGLLTMVNHPDNFPKILLNDDRGDLLIPDILNKGGAIVVYEKMMNETHTKSNSFERVVYDNLNGLCLNQHFFSSETMVSKYNENIHDILVGFTYTGNKWSVSLRSTKPEVDVSIIAKQRGGGGHKGAAGFEVDTFEEIFN